MYTKKFEIWFGVWKKNPNMRSCMTNDHHNLMIYLLVAQRRVFQFSQIHAEETAEDFALKFLQLGV